MTVTVLLNRLESVKGTGRGRWVARCPAHDDKRPSLAVRELDDGRVLIHCFAGCDVRDVLGNCGLTFDALYPDESPGPKKSERRPFFAADVLRAVAFEALIAAVAAASIGRGEVLSVEDRHRLMIASVRLQAAVRESGHA